MAGLTALKGFRYPQNADLATYADLQNLAADLEAAGNAEDALRTSALHRPGCRAFTTTPFNVTKNLATIPTLSTVSFDTGGLVNLGVHADRFTVPSAAYAGLWWIGAWAVANNNAMALTVFEVSMRRNALGTMQDGIVDRGGPNSAQFAEQSLNIGGFLVLANGDFVQLATYWNGGAAGPMPYSQIGFTAVLVSS